MTARLCRVRGRLEAARGHLPHAEEAYQRALDALDGLPMPFERAQVELAYGQALRDHDELYGYLWLIDEPAVPDADLALTVEAAVPMARLLAAEAQANDERSAEDARVIRTLLGPPGPERDQAVARAEGCLPSACRDRAKVFDVTRFRDEVAAFVERHAGGRG